MIVAAAIEVLDEAGFAGLSMRRVADRLGTGAASLYAHVSGREELLELVFDALVGQAKLEEPDPARWREQLHRLMRDAFYASLPADRYPVLTAVAPAMTGPDADDRFEFGLNVLIAGLEAASAGETAGDQPGTGHPAHPSRGIQGAAGGR
jgi:AcrR family transcriptional regulator